MIDDPYVEDDPPREENFANGEGVRNWTLNEVPEQFCLIRDGVRTLWCENRGVHSDTKLRFWVQNGHWNGYIKNGEIYVGSSDTPCGYPVIFADWTPHKYG